MSLERTRDLSRLAEDEPRLRVGFVNLRNFTLTPFAGFIDVLRLATDEGDRSRQGVCRWTVMSPGREPVQASCGTLVQPDSAFVEPASFDYIVVVGGLLHGGLPADDRIDAYLRDAARKGVRIVGLCTAVITLIRLGLMSGRRCCVSWYHYWDLVNAFPDVTPIADQLFVVDGPRITCAGGTGAIDVAAWIVRTHLGETAMNKALHILIADRARPPEAPQPHVASGIQPRDPRLRQALALIEQALANPPDMNRIAATAGISRRQLERLFRTELGVSPSEYSLGRRLRQGHWLLTRTERSITDIAYECGFADASHFSRHIRNAFGASPLAVRTIAQATGEIRTGPDAVEPAVDG